MDSDEDAKSDEDEDDDDEGDDIKFSSDIDDGDDDDEEWKDFPLRVPKLRYSFDFCYFMTLSHLPLFIVFSFSVIVISFLLSVF